MSDTILIITVLAAIIALTVAVDLTLGKKIAKRSRMLAIIICGLSIPLLIAIGAYADFYIRPGSQPDAGSLALAGSLIYAAIALPFTLIVSAITIMRMKRSTSSDEASPPLL